MKRKILVTLLAFCLIASLCVVGAAAAGEPCDGVDCDHEAAIGNVHYNTFEDAINAAVDGNTVTLLRNCEISGVITVDVGITIDLGGNTLTLEYASDAYYKYALIFTAGSSEITNGTIIDKRSLNNTTGNWIIAYVTGAGSLTTSDVTFQSYYPNNEQNYNYAIRGLATAEAYGTITLNSGTVIEELEQAYTTTTYGVAGVCVYGPYSNQTVGEMPSDYVGETLIINDGVSINTKYLAVSGNGSAHGTTYVINGGSITSQFGTGIYHPQAGNMTINGGIITGETGVEIRAGNVTINGGTISGTGSPTTVEPNGNGTTSNGVGVAVAQHTTSLPINLTINDGVISGYSAVYESNPQNNEDIAHDVNIDITDGDFNAINGGTQTIYSEDVNNFITGGSYTNSVALYVADSLSFEANSNGVYTYHSTIESAVEAAGNGGSVSMISNGAAVDPDDEGVHTITRIDGGSEITMTVTDGYVYTLPELYKNGYTFTGWRVNSSNTIVKGGESYPITANTTFTAVWNMIMIPDTYDIAVDQPAHGTVDVSLSNASQGSVITVTATPDEGYELVYITVDGEPISGNSFVMPDHAVEVSALFAEIGKEVNFVDVSRADWFYDYVQYVAQNGLMEGTTRTAFEPNASMTRAMFWTVLARIDGETITGDAWKTLAQTWAVESGISDGTNADALITREQMVTMLYRYAGSPVAGGMAISEFTDGASVSGYATDAVTWALSEGILTGMGDGILAPQGTATRAQAAAMLMRFVEA